MAPTTQDLEKLRNPKLPIIWVLGGPGSGKGTQCAKLVERYGFQHLSSGDLLRDEVASGSDLGKSLTETMAKGQLVSREIVLELIRNAMLKQVASAKGYLIDGYPREVEQGEAFESEIAPCALIIYFDCSDESMKQRLLARAVTSGRSDDNEATIVKRLDTFHKVSEPVMEKYSTKVAKIDANTDTATIFQKCKERVDTLLKDIGVEVPA